MAKPGRNDRCPCGSGKKYKQCCLTADEADERREMLEAEVRRAERVAAAHPELMRELKGAVAAQLGISEEDLARSEALMDASNAVVDLIHAGRLDEAEAAARHLIAEYPDEHDGWARLGRVHERRGANREAADCYRRMLAVIARRPDDYDPAMVEDFTKLVAKLDPPAG